MLRADMAGVKYRIKRKPTPRITSSTVASSIFRPRTTPRTTGLGWFDRAPAGPAFGLAAGLFDGGGPSLRGAALGTFAAGPPARPLEFVLIGRRFDVGPPDEERFGDRAVGRAVGHRAVGGFADRARIDRLRSGPLRSPHRRRAIGG